MKMHVRTIALLTLIATVFLFTSCSVPSNDSHYDRNGSGGDSLIGDSIAPSGYGDGTSSSPAPDSSEKGDSDSTAPDDSIKIEKPAGLITAGAWNDNSNYEYWKSLFEQNGDTNGKFFSYSGANSWGLNSYNRLKVSVSLSGDEGTAVAGASVIAKNSEGTEIYRAVTDANGVAYLFTSGESGTVSVQSGEHTVDTEYTDSDEELTVKLGGALEKKNVIDIMFVVDVTGSMGDELNYLKNELSDVINKVAANDTEAVINLALLFYRDSGDSVPFAYYDFVDVTNPEGLAAQQANLSSQYADGGGDYPEAVDEALAIAVGKQWNTGATTKLIFHILDAPPHETTEHKAAFKAAVETASEKGIRICPIICSGTGVLTEYLMRQAAIYTAGTFIFVTDDSGIGNSHYDPELPNVTVEALNSLLVRLIDGYHTGDFAPAVHWKEEQLNAGNQ